MLVLVLAVDLRLQVGALLQHGSSALHHTLEAHLRESEGLPAHTQQFGAVAAGVLGSAQQHVSEQELLVLLV